MNSGENSIAPQVIIGGHRPSAAEEVHPWTPYMQLNHQGDTTATAHKQQCHEPRIFDVTTDYLARFFFPPPGPSRCPHAQGVSNGHPCTALAISTNSMCEKK